MKYAVFEFVSGKGAVTCEVGETRWIVREDEDMFNAALWDFEKDVMVLWPSDCSNLSKKIMKSSIDPETVETTTCVAKIVAFSGKSLRFDNHNLSCFQLSFQLL